MQRLKSFLWTAVLGGLTVILPAAIVYMVFGWLFGKIDAAIEPITSWVTGRFGGGALFADLLVIALLVGVCFAVGLAERTRLGHGLFGLIERLLLNRIPGYGLVKETVLQFTGGKQSPFSQVALVRLYDSDVTCTAFVTDRHEAGAVTVFVPTGPNPTSGNIFHLPADRVTLVNHPVESTMRSIISCGAGSGELLAKGRAARAAATEG